ncbi:MAG: peroxiredoxin [Candidatus Micrarchaeaceae archaeon]
MIKIGDKIPDFETDALIGGSIKKIRLREYLGRWMIFIFYPADFSFVCPTELEDAAKHYDEFKSLDAEVFSVSTDTAFSHMAWHDTSPAIKQIKFPMIADPSAKMCKEFGTYIEDEGLSLRGTFLVDPDGIVKAIEMHDNSLGRNIGETLRRLKAARHVREFPGEVCPVNWEPGKKTLKPSPDLVGKI